MIEYTSNSTGGIAEAPKDDNYYTRRNGTWSNIDEYLTGGNNIEYSNGVISFNVNSDIDFQGYSIVNLSDPYDDQEVATKSYVDSQSQGLIIKDAVRVASDGSNIDLTSTADPNPIDGVTLNDGDRILLKNQTDATQNGIYVASTATDPSTWARSSDADEDAEMSTGMYTLVSEGTVNGGNGFVLSTTQSITLGTTQLTFTQFSSAGQVVAGTGIFKDGNILNHESASVHELGGSLEINHNNLVGYNSIEHIDWTISQTDNIHPDNYTDTDTHINVSESGTQILSDISDINFTASGDASINVTDDTDGSVTVNISATNTDTTYTAGSGLILSGNQFSLSGDEFNSNETYINLRAQATTKDDVGLGNVPNTNIAYSESIPADEFASSEVSNLRTSRLANGTTPWTSNNHYDDTDVDNHLSGGFGITYTGGTISVVESDIDHNNLQNYVSNEHIDWTIEQDINVNRTNIDKSAITQYTYSQSDLGIPGLASIDGVFNQDGDVDLVSDRNITISPDNANNQIVFSVPDDLTIMANHTTDELKEGPNNLYFTTNRVDQYLNAGTGISYYQGTIANTDLGSDAINQHENAYDHTAFITDITEQRLSNLSNVESSSPPDNYVLAYNATTEKWEPRDMQTASTDAPVDSVFGRTGSVIANSDDYSASQITNDSSITGSYINEALDNLTTDNITEGSNLYFTTTRVNDHLSGGTGITYSDGVISVNVSNIDHNSLQNYVSNEHIDWTVSQSENIHPDNVDVVNTHTNVSRNGTEVLTNVSDINFVAVNNANVTVDDDGDGSVTVEVSSTDTTYTSSDFNHDQLTNTHNLTTDIDHNNLQNYVSNEHIDWTINQDTVNVNDANINKSAVTQYTYSQSDLGISGLLSIDGVSNQDGDVDLVSGGNITISSDNTNNTITFTVPNDLTDIANYTTDDLNEGASNLYFTTDRIDNYLSGGNNITYSSGSISINITSDLDFKGSYKPINVVNPTDPQDVATKSYVDSIEQGLDLKDSVRAAPTGNIDLTSNTDPNPIDDVSLNDGDRVLLMNQSDATENGIYIVSTAIDPTTWSRSQDANEDTDVNAGLFTFVEEGTTYNNKGFAVTTNDPITVGSTNINFTQFTSAGQVIAGTALTKSGDTISHDSATVHEAGGSREVNHNNLLNYVSNEHIDWTIDQGTTNINDNNVKKTAITQYTFSQSDLGISGLLSLTGVSNQDGNVDLVNGGNITISPDDGNNQITLSVPNDLTVMSNYTTDDLNEGSSNLYFTSERVDDRINNLLSSSGSVTLTYDDVGNVLTIGENHSTNTNNPHSVTASQVGSIVSIDGVSNAGGNIDLIASGGITISSDNSNNQITLSVPSDLTELNNYTTDDLNEGSSNVYFTTTRVDNHLTAGTGIDYTNGTITNTDTGSDAVSTHESNYDHTSFLTTLPDHDNTSHTVNYEEYLGTPSVDDYILASKTDGTRLWIENTGGVDEAPTDGNKYLRENSSWVEMPETLTHLGMNTDGDLTWKGSEVSTVDVTLPNISGDDAYNVRGKSFIVPINITQFGTIPTERLMLAVKYKEDVADVWQTSTPVNPTSTGTYDCEVSSLLPLTTYEYYPVAYDAFTPSNIAIGNKRITTTSDAYPETPALTVEGMSNTVPSRPLLESTNLTISDGSTDIDHNKSDWVCIKSDTNEEIWASRNDTTNLTSIVQHSDEESALEPNTTYLWKHRQHCSVHGWSDWASITASTKDVFMTEGPGPSWSSITYDSSTDTGYYGYVGSGREPVYYPGNEYNEGDIVNDGSNNFYLSLTKKNTGNSLSDNGYWRFIGSGILCTYNDVRMDTGLQERDLFDDGWLKFYVGSNAVCSTRHDTVEAKNRTIFVAKRPVSVEISWKQIYDAGCVYGTDDDGLIRWETAQDTRIIIGGFTYKIRLLTGSLYDPNSGSKDNLDGSESEWNELIERIHSDNSTGLSNWESFNNHDINIKDGDGRSTLTQELWKDDPSDVEHEYCIHRGENGLFSIDVQGLDSGDNKYGWRPVLEIEE